MSRIAVFPVTEEVEIDFGFSGGGEGDTASVTVPADWITAASKIICQPCLCNGPDHGPEDPVVENISVKATRIVAGVSFDIEGYAPQGTWGRFRVAVIGL